MFSLNSFEQKYDVETNEVTINRRKFQFYLPKSIEPFINPDNPLEGFPLWAKIWKSSLILADFMAREPVVPDKHTLEIGSGIGLVGIAAAAFGHRMTISDCNPNAIEFARANAYINGCPDLKIDCMDWNIPETIHGNFDRIIASEIIYKKEDLAPVQSILKKLLKADGEIIMASEFRKAVIEFIDIMNQTHHLEIRRMKLRSGDEELSLLISKMKPKNIY